MSEVETVSSQRITRSSFASRLLTKELDLRKKSTKEMAVDPAELQKFAPPPQDKQESKESVDSCCSK